MKQKVSIVLPIYNGEKYMRQSIESCLRQTHEDIELIIVDDASTDNTASIAKSYDDPRIKYLKHEKNMGLPSALNTGFEKASGGFLTWTSHDNYFAENAIEKMLAALEEKKVSFVYCDYFEFKKDDLSDKFIRQFPDEPGLEERNTVGACFLYTREVLEKVGKYDPDLVLAEDYDYWIRISKKFPTAHLGEPLYYYRVHEGTLTSRYAREFDIQIISIITRLKNKLIDKETAIGQYIGLIVKRDRQKRTALLRYLVGGTHYVSFKKIDRKNMSMSIAKFILANRVRAVFRDFENGKLDAGKAKYSLKEIVEKSLI